MRLLLVFSCAVLGVVAQGCQPHQNRPVVIDVPPPHASASPQRTAASSGDLALGALTSGSAEAIALAAAALTAKISPWQRAIASAAKDRRVALFQGPRPTSRAVHHLSDADAARIEAAAITALDALESKPRGEGASRLHAANARRELILLLAEVARDAGDERLRRELRRASSEEDDGAIGVWGGSSHQIDAMRALESMVGLPAFYEPRSLQCGEPGPPDVTRAIFDAHRAKEHAAFLDGRAKLLAWLDAHAKEPRASAVRAAFAEWDARSWVAQPNQSPHGIDFSTVLRYETIVRLGDDALTELQRRRAATQDDREAARYEVLIAAISGKVDDASVRRWLASSDHRVIVLATEIIGAAGDKRWLRELDALQLSRMSEVAHAASRALAGVHGREALPLLRAAAAQNADNYTAKYAALELDEPAKSNGPK